MKLLSRISLNHILLLTFITAASLFFWRNIDAVPFHPDEATQIYMSADFDQLLSNPVSMAWTQANGNDPVIRYRLLDSPLTRYSIGLFLRIRGQAPIAVDWNWALTWQQNETRGALPSPEILQTARVSVAWVYPFSLLMIYLIASKMIGERAAWLSLFLFAGNALILLHTRRAMAESLLTFFILLNLVLLLYLKPQQMYWLGALSALAICAKQSTAVLLPLNLIATVWIQYRTDRSWKKGFLTATAFFGLFALVFMGLNPVFWQHPFSSAQAALTARQSLLQSQVEMIRGQNPEQILSNLPLKAGNLLAHSFITPPMIAESGNYLQATHAAETAYFANPLHNLFRSMFFGAIYLILTLTGGIMATLETIRAKTSISNRAGWVIAAGLFLAASLIVMVPVPWQRYVIPIIPFSCIFAAWPLKAVLNRKNSP